MSRPARPPVNGTRAFLPLLLGQDDGVIVNTAGVFGLVAAMENRLRTRRPAAPAVPDDIAGPGETAGRGGAR